VQIRLLNGGRWGKLVHSADDLNATAPIGESAPSDYFTAQTDSPDSQTPPVDGSDLAFGENVLFEGLEVVFAGFDLGAEDGCPESVAVAEQAVASPVLTSPT